MFAAAVEAAARAHAVRDYPREACGLVIGGEYRAFANVAVDLENEFQLPADAPHVFEAVIHSHCAPAHGIEPSAADMRGQMETAVPWGIVLTDGKTASAPLWWGDFRLDEPLIGRQFCHGVLDCYSLIEARWWQECKVRLPIVPRDREWWERGGDLYREGFASAGFRQITEAEAAPGDVVLMQVRSKVPNHGGIIRENGLVLHHLQNRLSRQEPLGGWRKFITHWLRRE